MAIGIFAHSDGAFQNPILLGAREAARKYRTSLLVYRSPTMSNYSGLDAAMIRSQYRVDRTELEGLILSFAAPGLTQYGLSLYRAGLPVISIGRSLEELPHCLLENTAAIRDMVLALASRGHRDIAYLAGPESNQCAVDRLAGYRNGMDRAGLGDDPRMTLEGAFEESPGYAAVKRARQSGLRFSALVCANDLSAMGALKALEELGLSVPQDVEVTGFDNSVLCKLSQPTLSSFATNNFELGYLAADQLMRATQGEPLPTSKTIPVDFVARQSTRTAATTIAQPPPRSDFWTMPPREATLWLARFRDIDGTETMLKQLAECRASIEYVASTKNLLRIAEEHGIPPACLHDTVSSGASCTIRMAPLAMAEAAEQLYETIRRQEYKKAELHVRFIAHTAQLRQSAVQPTDEEILLEEMKRVLWELGVPHAEIYLSADDVAIDAGLYDAVIWSQRTARLPFREERRHLTAFSTQRMMREQGEHSGSWMVVPLIFHDLQYGVAVVSRETVHEFLLPELIQQFSTAIYTNRVHRALAQANRELEESRNVAEAANAELLKAQSKLVETSRLAGIAEMATGILHNIGNALTSVNTSAGLAIARLRGIKFENLERVVQLLEQHRTDLDRFVREDPRGNNAFDYLKLLSRSFLTEQAAVAEELKLLRDGVEHINGIVAAQQSRAGVAEVVEEAAPAEIVEYVVRICEALLLQHEVNLTQELLPVPRARVQRQKVVQILVNLITNAKDAVKLNSGGARRITLRLQPVGAKAFQIVVEDNGVGIPNDDLARIFAFGFTSKDGRRGFGLHNSALAAYEMKGSLTAKSEGEGKGATFVLELPLTEDPGPVR
jgi:DNA-binding LacI/PurR family transcriptional regulator/signal transduction histidine kinase